MLTCVLYMFQPYYPVPKEAAGQATQYVLSRVAPKQVWPPMTFGASMACWYEHITRLICLVICKNHRVWEFLTKLITRNRSSTFKLYYCYSTLFCHLSTFLLINMHVWPSPWKIPLNCLPICFYGGRLITLFF